MNQVHASMTNVNRIQSGRQYAKSAANTLARNRSMGRLDDVIKVHVCHRKQPLSGLDYESIGDEIGGIPCFKRAIVQASSPGSQARHTSGRMS
ncbi:MAG: hypothetical protein HC841_06680 [Verrucomicrobiae bacterium]|nr:hypothetical protein [Verrucomicrobiae bacterium]